MYFREDEPLAQCTETENLIHNIKQFNSKEIEKHKVVQVA